MSEKFYINSSIPYANGTMHVGHAIEFFYADTVARYRKHMGDDVLFVHGIDQHGQKNADVAIALGKTPLEYVNEMGDELEALLDRLHIYPDDFVRTTQERHKIAAQKMWQVIAEAGDIEQDEYEGLYCVGCEEFKTEKDLTEDGLCPNHQKKPEILKEKNYFFRLSRFQDRLLEFYESHPDFIIPKAKYNEMKELVKGGLEDLSISRDVSKMSWGIPVPGDDTQVMYVWFEALMNYVTTAGYGQDDEQFARLWPTDFRTIGKDINRFHTVVWPAMLMSAGLEPEKQIGVHGFVTVEGQKISKTIGNVIDPIELVEKYGVDTLRYFLLREVAFENDGDFSFSRLEERYSADLANGLGNLVSRVTNMVEKYFKGDLESSPREQDYGNKEKEEYHVHMNQLEFSRALGVVWSVIDDANEYIEQHQPWELAKSDTQKLKEVLQHLLFALELVADWLVPFIPDTAQKLSSILSAEVMAKSEPMFPRLDSEK